jgi:putative MFS transporter
MDYRPEGRSGTRTVAVAEQIVSRLEEPPRSGWQTRARLVVGAATLFDGVDTLAIAYVLPVLMVDWRLSPKSAGILISAGYLGQLAGGVFFGWLAERIGRVATIRYTIAVYAVLSLFCAASWSYASLLVFRVLQGVGLGGEVPVAATYINEIAKTKNRGRFFLLYEQAYSAGRLVAALLGVWLVSHVGWRYVFLMGGLPAALVFFLRRWLPESPRWLADQGRLEEAAAVVGGTPHLADLPLKAARSDWRELFSAGYRTRTWTTWVIWFAAFLLLNGLANWVPTLYITVYHLDLQTALRYSLISSAGGFAGCIAVALLIERVGRRPWFILAFALAGAACISLWFLQTPSARSVLVLTTITAFLVNSIAMVVFLHTPEIYPTRIRALATSVASAWLRIASIVAPLFIALMLGHSSLPMVFLSFGVTAWLASLVATLTVETKGRVLEDIAP